MDPKAARRVLARVLGMQERELVSLDGELDVPEEGLAARVREALGARNARLPLELYNAVTGVEWDPQDGITTGEAVGFVRALARVVKPRHVLVTGRLRPLDVGSDPLPKKAEAARRRLAYRLLCTAFKLEPEELKRLATPLRLPADPVAVRALLWSHMERADFRPAAALVAGGDYDDVERVLERVTPEVKPWHAFYSRGDGVWGLELRPLTRESPTREKDVTAEAYAIAVFKSYHDNPLESSVL